MADSKLIDLPALTTPSADDVLYIVDDPTGTPISKKITYANLTAGLGGGGGGGVVVQVKNVQTGAVSAVNSIIPLDDTIPQITEGSEYMTLAITPTSATNKLKIDVVLFATSSNPNWVIVGLFQDATANALAAYAHYQNIGTGFNGSTFTHTMTAGTTSATTFRVRAGRDASSAGTVTVNGASGARYLGGVMTSGITITEYVP